MIIRVLFMVYLRALQFSFIFLNHGCTLRLLLFFSSLVFGIYVLK